MESGNNSNTEKPKMVQHCNKCGHERKTELEYPDQGVCPNCGRHGQITLSNSQAILDKRGNVKAFVPAR